MIRAVLIWVLMLGFAGSLTAQERSSLLPDVPMATGEPHAEGNAYWRKYHMDMMLHDRDLTMRLGDREVKASLKACFDCHAAKDDSGAIVTIQSEKHFCRTCHDYAAVKVDCFSCHRSTPEGVDEGGMHALTRTGAPDRGAIAAFLAGLVPAANAESMIPAGNLEVMR